MSRAFRIDGRAFQAPRYGDMMAIARLATDTHVHHQLVKGATVAQMAEWMINTLPLWLAAIRSAWSDVPATDEEAELWLTDQGLSLHELVNLGSGILQEYRVRLGFISAEAVQSHADFTVPSQADQTTC